MTPPPPPAEIGLNYYSEIYHSWENTKNHNKNNKIYILVVFLLNVLTKQRFWDMLDFPESILG